MKLPSKKFRLSLYDLAQGAIMAGIGAGLGIATTMLQGSLVIDWKAVGYASAAAALSYISKKYFQGPKPDGNTKP